MEKKLWAFRHFGDSFQDGISDVVVICGELSAKY
jgi:hypothetical protein